METASGTVIIRKATLADMDAIAALHDQVYQETTRAFDEAVLTPTAAFIAPLERRIRTQDGGHRGAQVLVAQAETGEIVGYVMARHYRRSSSSIDQEVVAKDYRKYGVGQELTQHVIEHAETLNKKFVELNVSEAGNVAFHERQGFAQVRRRPANTEGTHAMLVMHRRLDDTVQENER